ncbi:hypothetical protein Pelo_6750 [Pelomyxa schiedti]|nr:hypothetical protein Pelo_6750 [Pelomyxa schiedti]
MADKEADEAPAEAPVIMGSGDTSQVERAKDDAAHGDPAVKDKEQVGGSDAEPGKDAKQQSDATAQSGESTAAKTNDDAPTIPQRESENSKDKGTDGPNESPSATEDITPSNASTTTTTTTTTTAVMNTNTSTEQVSSVDATEGAQTSLTVSVTAETNSSNQPPLDSEKPSSKKSNKSHHVPPTSAPPRPPGKKATTTESDDAHPVPPASAAFSSGNSSTSPRCTSPTPTSTTTTAESTAAAAAPPVTPTATTTGDSKSKPDGGITVYCEDGDLLLLFAPLFENAISLFKHVYVYQLKKGINKITAFVPGESSQFSALLSPKSKDTDLFLIVCEATPDMDFPTLVSSVEASARDCVVLMMDTSTQNKLKQNSKRFPKGWSKVVEKQLNSTSQVPPQRATAITQYFKTH